MTIIKQTHLHIELKNKHHVDKNTKVKRERNKSVKEI